MACKRFCLVQDNSSHWYIIPVSRREAWDAHCSLDEDDEAGWDTPEWAERVDGSPESVHFENPRQTTT